MRGTWKDWESKNIAEALFMSVVLHKQYKIKVFVQKKVINQKGLVKECGVQFFE